MSKELKSIPCFHIKSASSGRSRTGIAAVFGNIDQGDDRIHLGAFKRTINKDAGIRHKHLWGHDWSHPPIAAIKQLREVGRNELPQEVLDYAPEATGGLLVEREYFKSDLCDLVLQGIDAGAMEMSIGYDAKQIEYTQETKDGEEIRVRELKEVQLLETSDVPFGMNAATSAAFAKALGDRVPPLGTLIQYLSTHAHNIKAGRRNAAQDLALIDQLHEISLDLGCVKCLGLEAEGEKAHDNDNPSAEPAPVNTDTALLANELKLNDLRLSQFFRSV